MPSEHIYSDCFLNNKHIYYLKNLVYTYEYIFENSKRLTVL